MAHLFTMPRLGSTMEEGTIVKWRKQEGDAVKKGDVLLEVETDKTAVEVEATQDGVLRKILVSESATASVNHPLAILGTAEETIGHLLPQGDAASEKPPAISPRARRVAEENGVELHALTGRGTGPEGRIIERDVRGYLEEQNRLRPVDGPALNDLALGLPGSRLRSDPLLAPVRSQESQGEKGRVPGSYAPGVTLTLEVDMTACADFRQRARSDVEKGYGAELLSLDILIKAVACALGEYPLLHATRVEEEIRLPSERNLGIVVALDKGIAISVLKQADRKTLGAIAAERTRLVAQALADKSLPEDPAGGTFTIIDLGAFEIEVFDPILVRGQTAVLGVGRISDRPVVLYGEIVVRTMMNLCLSFDPRLLDSVPAARFLHHVKQLLESPLSILL